MAKTIEKFSSYCLFSSGCFRWGLQNKVESFIQGTEKRIFTNFHREVKKQSFTQKAKFHPTN